MVTQMTRAEYQAKYGVQPTSPSSPVKMTRAEYEKKYGSLPKQDVLDGFAKAQTPSTLGGMVSPTFSAVAGESPLSAGAKALGNVPSSVFGLGKGLFEAVTNPVQTVKGVAGVVSGAGSKILENTVGRGVEALTGQPVQRAKTPEFDAITQILKERYGSLEALQKTATEDPVGFGADVLSIVEGGAGLVGRAGQVSRGVSRVGQAVTRPISSTAGALTEKAGEVARFGISQATGLNPETITNIVKNPQALKNINPELRVETAQRVADVLDSRLTELSDVGKGYETIRQVDVPVNIPKDTVPNTLNKYGIKLDENNRIITSPQSRPLSPADRTALQDFIDNYGRETQLTSNSFLNTREALSNLSKFEQGKTSLSSNIARDLRAQYDAIGKEAIPGLKNLDAVYAPERQLLGQLKKDILTPGGELKDGAISKIANITGKGKEQLLERVKQIVPDIEERVRLIKTVEDIEAASGIKVGTYARAGLGLSGVALGNAPAIIGAILAQPEIAVPLLKGAGYAGQKARPILEAIKSIANDINNFTLPKPILNYMENPKVGLSVQNIAKNMTSAEKGTLRDFTDYVNGSLKVKDEKFIANLKRDAQDIAGKYGFDITATDRVLSNQIAAFLDKIGYDKQVSKKSK